jgi:hypothetical protein
LGDPAMNNDDLLGKKVQAKGKTGEIARVYEVIGFKDNRRVNVKWDNGTVSVNVWLSDLEIVE